LSLLLVLAKGMLAMMKQQQSAREDKLTELAIEDTLLGSMLPMRFHMKCFPNLEKQHKNKKREIFNTFLKIQLTII